MLEFFGGPGCVIVLTTFPVGAFPASAVLVLHGLRCQIGLPLKRFKLLAELDQRPRHNDESATAWLFS